MANIVDKFQSAFNTITQKLTSTNQVFRDVSDQVEVLGQPFSKSAYARNVWDMQQYCGRIYLASGDRVGNSGTDGIISFNPRINSFSNEFKVTEEAITKYVVIDGELYVPGADPKESFDWGNYYRLECSWVKYRNIPYGVHANDMISFGGTLFAAITTTKGSILPVSNDGGESWTKLDDSLMKDFNKNMDTVFTLFKFQNKLYAASSLQCKGSSNRLLCIEKTITNGKKTFSSSIITANNMVPLGQNYAYYTLSKCTELSGKLLYIGVSLNDTITGPTRLLYCSSVINKPNKITLPESQALPWDILVRDGQAYILASLKNSDGKYNIIVYATTNGSGYTEILRFTQDTFARSFEELNGDFYFGLGCNKNEVSESSGKILRVSGVLWS